MPLDRTSLLESLRAAAQSNQEMESQLAIEFVEELRALLSEEGDPIEVARAILNLGHERVEATFGATAAALGEAWMAAIELSQNIAQVRDAATPRTPTPLEVAAVKALEPLTKIFTVGKAVVKVGNPSVDGDVSPAPTLGDPTYRQVLDEVLEEASTSEWDHYTDDDIREYLVQVYEQMDEFPTDGFLAERCQSYRREIDGWDRESLKDRAKSLNEDEEHTFIRMASTLGRVRPGDEAEGDAELKPRNPRWAKYPLEAMRRWLMEQHHYGALEECSRNDLIAEIIEQCGGDEAKALERMASDDIPF